MSDVNDQRRYYERMMDEIAVEHRQQIGQLEDENAKLRGQYEAVIDDYRSEVAKLRELCRYLLPFAESCGAEHPLMRELGIEVNDGTE